MLNHLIHPGTIFLLRCQSVARVKRLVRGFATPRRCLLSVFSLALAVFWLGNIAVSIAFREPTTPENFRGIVTASLLAYALWHLLKVACRLPEDPYEWSPAERQCLLMAPLSRDHLIGYRLMSILMAALIKALCFSLLMLPELRVWSLGILGGFLALVFLDLLRFSVEIAVCAMKSRVYLRFRFLVITTAMAVGISCLIQALITTTQLNDASPVTLFTTFVGNIAACATRSLERPCNIRLASLPI